MNPKRFEYLTSLQSPEEVIRESQILLMENPDSNEEATLLWNISVSLVQLGRLKEARQIVEKMNHLEISDPETRLNVEFTEPCLLVLEGRSDEALSAFTAMLERNVEALKKLEYRYLYEDIQSRLASVLFDLSKFKEALPILLEAVEYSTVDQPADRQRIYFQLGVCLYHEGDTKTAKEEFLRVVRLSLKNRYEERSLYWLGTICYQDGASAQTILHLESLLRDFHAAVATVPRHSVYEMLSKAFLYLGDQANGNVYASLAKEAQKEPSKEQR